MLYTPLSNTHTPFNKPTADEVSQPTNTKLVSEVIVPKTYNSLQLVLPSLAYLSRSNNKQWLTWITDSPLPLTLLQHFEFNLHNLRVIYVKDQEHMKSVLTKVLQDCASHTVIANPGRISQQEFKSLELSAFIGKTRAVLVRFNEH